MLNESSTRILERMKRQRLYPTIKRAADDAKASFEINFYKLTDAIIAEHLPGIEKYDLGFQLVDKTKDNSKAFGVRAFRLKTLVFVPFFYDNGKVSGYELFYLPKANIFVPTGARWVTYLRQKGVSDFGEPTEDKDFADYSGSPNLLPLRRPMAFKSAAWLKVAETKQAYKKLVPHAVNIPFCAGRFISLLDKYPFLVEKCAQVYGKSTLQKMVKAARAAIASISEENLPKVAVPVSIQEKAAKIRFYGPFDDTFDLKPKEVDILQKTGFFVKDARDESEKSKVVPAVMDQSFNQVGRPGLYTVLNLDMEKRKILVLPRDEYSYYGVERVERNAFPSFKDSWLVCDITKGFNDRFVRYDGPIYYVKEHPSEEFRKVLEKLPKVDFDSLVDKRVRAGELLKEEDLIIDPVNYRAYEVSPRRQVVVSNWNRILRKVDKDVTLLFVPPTAFQARILYSAKPELYMTPDLAFHWSRKVASHVKVYFDRDRFIINKKAFEKAGALKHLIVDYGVSVKDGLRILKEAQMYKQARYLVKRADSGLPPYILQSEKPVVDLSGEVRMEFAPGYPAEGVFETERWIPGLKRPQPITNIMEPPPEKVFNTLKRLSESNEGDVFDLGLLVSLIHGTRSTDVIDGLVPHILRGLDGLGRVLFVLYRHKDKLKEAYGDDDYNRLVDEVRTNFEQLGECVLDLVQDKIEPYVQKLENLDSEVKLD